MRMKPLPSAAAAATLWLSSLAAANAEIVVGVVQSQTGPVSSIGLPYVRGTAAGQAYIPEVGGEKFRVIVLDDASDPSTAAKNTRKLIEEDKVDVIMGTAGAPATAALIAVASELKVPVIAPTPVPSVPKVDGKPWAVSTPQNPRDMFGIIVDEMKAQSIKTVGFIGFSDAWGDLVYNMTKRAADPYGIEIVTNERYARSDTSVRAQVLKVMAAKPDAFLNGGSGTGGALPLQGLAERGFKGKLYGGPSLINPDFVRLVGAAGEGVIVAAGPIVVLDQLPDAHPTKGMGLKFREAYQKAHNEGTKDIFAPYAFDCWLILADAARRALPKAKPGTAEFRSAMRDEIYATKELVGTHGVYNYSAEAHVGTDRRALVLVQLKGGEWKLYK
ncbi:MAG: ABC transporter substrate-binding protein [Hyphomicrobiaceae bacterium]|nr:ABC transporter substrate-binding protein [Hyphomicrobiaceae bacterium]